MNLSPRVAATREGWIASRDPRARVLAALGLALVSVFLHQVLTALLLLGLGLGLALVDGAPVKILLKRLVLLQLLMLSLLISLPLQVPGESIGQIAGQSISREGLQLALVIFCKANGVALALLGLLSSMEPMQLGQALARLGAPDKLAHLLMLSLRQIHLLHQEYQRLRNAMLARGFVPGSNRQSWQSYAHLMGSLLVRALERARRLEAAMRARGFQGRFYLLGEDAWGTADSLFLALLLELVFSLLVIEYLVLA